MIIFFLVAALMLAIALSFVLVPLLRPRRAAFVPISDEYSNITIFRTHKQELDDDVARGLISAEERDVALAELSQRVLAEVPVVAIGPVEVASAAAREKHSWIVAICLAMFIPVVAILGYLAWGAPQALQMLNKDSLTTGKSPGGAAGNATPNPNPDGNASAKTEAPLSDKQILAMVDSLAKKMNDQPGDPKGWILLARSQNALGRYPQAAQAYERALKLLPNDAQLMADYADVLVMTQEGRFDGKPYQLIQQALKRDGNNLKVLALAGTAEMRLGNRAESLKHWQKLKTLIAKDSDDYREVEAIIAEVMGKPAEVVAAPAGTATNGPPPLSVPSAAAVSGSVTIAPELAASIAPGDTLFVLARAASAAGGANPPRMPLAVLRVPAPPKWPYVFTLTDAMAMAPGMNLSSFAEVTIEARISKSGNTTLQPGDFSGQSLPVKPNAPGAKNLTISLSRWVP